MKSNASNRRFFNTGPYVVPKKTAEQVKASLPPVVKGTLDSSSTPQESLHHPSPTNRISHKNLTPVKKTNSDGPTPKNFLSNETSKTPGTPNSLSNWIKGIGTKHSKDPSKEKKIDKNSEIWNRPIEESEESFILEKHLPCFEKESPSNAPQKKKDVLSTIEESVQKSEHSKSSLFSPLSNLFPMLASLDDEKEILDDMKENKKLSEMRRTTKCEVSGSMENVRKECLKAIENLSDEAVKKNYGFSKAELTETLSPQSMDEIALSSPQKSVVTLEKVEKSI